MLFLISVIGAAVLIITGINLIVSWIQAGDISKLQESVKINNHLNNLKSNPARQIGGVKIRIDYFIFQKLFMAICAYINKFPESGWSDTQLIRDIDSEDKSDPVKIYLVPYKSSRIYYINSEEFTFSFSVMDPNSDIMDTIEISCPSRNSFINFLKNNLKPFISNSDLKNLDK